MRNIQDLINAYLGCIYPQLLTLGFRISRRIIENLAVKLKDFVISEKMFVMAHIFFKHTFEVVPKMLVAF